MIQWIHVVVRYTQLIWRLQEITGHADIWGETAIFGFVFLFRVRLIELLNVFVDVEELVSLKVSQKFLNLSIKLLVLFFHRISFVISLFFKLLVHLGLFFDGCVSIRK